MRIEKKTVFEADVGEFHFEYDAEVETVSIFRNDHLEAMFEASPAVMRQVAEFLIRVADKVDEDDRRMTGDMYDFMTSKP